MEGSGAGSKDDRRELMKKIIAFTLLLSTLTACGKSFVELPTTAPLQTQPPYVTSQSDVPLTIPMSTVTPRPGLTLTNMASADQVSMEHARIIYYEVTGSTAQELRASMNEFRPKDPHDGNHPVDAYTDWYVSWSWLGYGTGNCDLSTASVTHNINIILPHWAAPVNVSLELIAKWKKYIQSLVAHETGHVANVVNNYLSVKTAIQSATCLTADAEAQKALASLREFDARYDRETKHGETQGAVFP